MSIWAIGCVVINETYIDIFSGKIETNNQIIFVLKNLTRYTPRQFELWIAYVNVNSMVLGYKDSPRCGSIFWMVHRNVYASLIKVRIRNNNNA